MAIAEPLPMLGRLLRRAAVPVAALTAVNVAVGKLITRHGEAVVDETAIIEGLRQHRSTTADRLAKAVSTVSDVPASVALAAVSIPLLRRSGRDWPTALLPALAMGLETIAYVTAGALVNRERPDVQKLDREQPTSSFPSGHVGATVALMVVAWRLTGRVSSPVARAALRALCVAYPAMLAPARVYVGMHYPSDVAAGIINGLVCGNLAAAVVDQER